MSESVLWIGQIAPLGWDGSGNLPTRLATNQEQARDFMQDLLQFRRKNILLDIGWSPAMQMDGFFICQVIRASEDPDSDYGWACPLENYQTRDPSQVWQWLQRALSQYHD